MIEPVSRQRRRLLVRGLLAAATVCGLSAAARDAAAQKSSKASLLYQDHPHDGRHCGECKFFTPGADTTSPGTCAVVDGPIQPQGWCTAFSPRQ
jgi:hypothetical protein